MMQAVFKRYEKKYLITNKQLDLLLPEIESHMKQDEYGKYTIRNLYYDTDDFYLIRTSIDKPIYKEKLRLRCYDYSSDSPAVYLELKKKYNGIVYKRRAEFSLNDALLFVSDRQFRNDYIHSNNDKNVQILKELDYFLSFYPSLHPTVYLAYERTAYFSTDDFEMRLTIDSNIRARSHSLKLNEDAENTYLLNEESCIMEVKVRNTLPCWFASMLSRLKIYPVSFSKYGTYYSKEMHPHTKTSL